MTTLAEAYGMSAAQWEDRQLRQHRVEQAYQAVFDGAPNAADQKIVRDDLELFCGLRSPVMRETFHETANAAGRLAVWQRIHRFRDPRPTDAIATEGAQHERRHEPIPGGGVAERTDD